MNSFDFEITLNRGMELLSIKPPLSYNNLLDIAKERYDLTMINKLVYEDDGEDIKISGDTDYLNFLNYVEKEELKEIEILIKGEGGKGMKRKSSRKQSNIKPNRQGGAYDDDCINGIYHILF